MRVPRADEQPLPRYERREEVVSPWWVREEFHRLMREDLVGPKDGEDEELWTRVEARPSNRYVLGVLAPKNTRPPIEDQMQQPDGNESAEATEEGDQDETPLPADSMLSTSIGFTCCVDGDTDELIARFSWAVYRKQHSEKGFLTEKKGDPAMVWKRTAYTAEVTFSVDKGFDDKVHEEFTAVIFRARAYSLEDGKRAVSLFLENAQDGKDAGDEAWLFQVEMSVAETSGRACFVNQRLHHSADDADPMTRQQEDHLKLLFRKEVEFAIGHGTACDWRVDSLDVRRANAIWTDPMPSYEVRKSTTVPIPGAEARMEVLGKASKEELRSMLSPLIKQYADWIEAEAAKIDDPAELIETRRDKEAAVRAVEGCRSALATLEEGIELVCTDQVAYEAFGFANRVMHLQRLRGLYASLKRQDEKSTLKFEEFSLKEPPSWRMFQLAFILSSLPSLTQLDHPERVDSGDPLVGPTAELLWFPTGGGKTEAYLGLTAYTLAMRRLQGSVEGYDGENGVAVLMRYTLRLLTLQQFQRATTLICACEAERRSDSEKWGKTPFRIGLWVGNASTPNTIKQATDLLEAERGNKGAGGKGTLKQITSCPWCGSKIELGRDVEVDRDRGRVIFYCGDGKGRCEFGRAKSKGEGVPIVVVDEQLYRVLPSLVIATVDKFAQMPWSGQVGALFGKVDRYCPRHGFLCPASDHDSDNHRAINGLPAVAVKDSPFLRPPDLIIQDELHLITGPLGSLMGLYETAIDELCSWTVNGKLVRPKIVLSTATIKRAHLQVQRLFARRLRTFPARGINSTDMFFAKEHGVSEKTPGLRYVGVCAFGRRLKSTLIRVYAAALSSGRTLQMHYPEHSDQLQTLVGYFASLRELGGMRRLLEDSVKARCRQMDVRGLAIRTGISVEEMTSRRRASDIPQILSRLETKVPLEMDKRKELPYWPIDALIATNMISVGVDVPRLGLMVVTGQPKATSEYIQATSRVGRELPGIVLTVYNFSRARDVSHYEAFRGYHSAYHTHVENPSVTPFAAGAVDRGLSAVFVGMSRLSDLKLNAENSAETAPTNTNSLVKAREALRARGELCCDEAEEVERLVSLAETRQDTWINKCVKRLQQGNGIRYRDNEGTRVPLLSRPEDGAWKTFTCLNSLRGVEQTSHLVLVDGIADEDGEELE